MKALVVLLLLVGCSSPVIKNEPDMIVPIDGNYIAGCAHASVSFQIMLNEPIDPVHTDAFCMDLYLGWLEYKDLNH